jgi:hypothetical protein
MENRPIDQCGQRWIRALVVSSNMRLFMVGGVAHKRRWGLWHIELNQLDQVLADTGLPDGAHVVHLLTGEEEADGYARET